MAARHMQTKALDRVVAIAGGLGAIGERTAKGFKSYADGYNWQDEVKALNPETQGFFSAWLLGCNNLSQNMGEGVGIIRIAAELAVYVPKDVSSEMQSAWDLALDLADAIGTVANWEAGEGIPGPIDIQLAGVLNDNPNGPGICVFDFGAYGNGGIKVYDP